MELLYKSTRGGENKVPASRAILEGLAKDGGLFVPERIPALDVSMDELAGMTYQETAPKWRTRIIWNCSMEQRSLLRTWRCRFCRIL